MHPPLQPHCAVQSRPRRIKRSSSAFVSPVPILPHRCVSGRCLRVPTPIYAAKFPLPAPVTRASALDNVPEAVKLNAVAEALARRNELPAALNVFRQMILADVQIDHTVVAGLVDAVAATADRESTVNVAANLRDVLQSSELPGYASVEHPSLAALFAAAPHPAQPALFTDTARELDITAAVSFLAVVGASVSTEVVEPVLLHHAATEATTVLLLLITGLTLDRYSAQARVWNRISSGLGRLFSQDPVRQARVESAHFLMAYLLGLPWLCFEPDPAQLLALHRPAKAARATSGAGTLGTASIASAADFEIDDCVLDSYLVWLLAGVAAETDIDGKLIESNPRGALAALRRLQPKVHAPSGTNGSRGGLLDEQRARNALTVAKRLLSQHQVVHGLLADNMLKGVSAGECVAFLARKYANNAN